MSYRLLVRPEAEADPAAARDWYDSKRAALGREFVLAVEVVFARISRMPEACVIIYKSVRRAVARRFPYVVYYRITGDAVEVIAVQHGKRNPRRWQSRA